MKYVDEIRIETYEEIVELKDEYVKNKCDASAFYRGQSNCLWDIIPSIKRREGISEFEIIQQFTDNQHIDLHQMSLFECIAYMQHYNRSTRFLDLTTNLDVALYFACADAENAGKDGKVFMFKYGEREPSNQDVAILIELCLLQTEISIEKFSEHLISKYVEFQKYSQNIQKLNMQVIAFIDHGFVVKPNQNDYMKMKSYNPRIESQSGAFFICGNIMEPITSWDRIDTHAGYKKILPEIGKIPSTLWHPDHARTIVIPSSKKDTILSIIAKKGITKKYLFPEE